MTAATQEPKVKKDTTRIAHYLRNLLPIEENSALVPPDKWILKTAYDFMKGNKSFHDTMGRAALYAGGGLTAVIAGAIGAVVLFPLALPMAAVGIAAVGATVFAGVRAKQHFEKFKKETLPELRNEFGKKYLDYKMSELKAAWQRNLEERRKKKAEEKAQKHPEQKTAPEPEAKQPAVKEAPKPQAQPAATAEKPATAPKPAEKKSLGSAFAELAKKMAEERARKLKEKEAQPKNAKPDAPKPPAA